MSHEMERFLFKIYYPTSMLRELNISILQI